MISKGFSEEVMLGPDREGTAVLKWAALEGAGREVGI